MADKLLSTVKGFERGTLSSGSTGGNFAADSGKALIFDANGGITGSTATINSSAIFGTTSAATSDAVKGQATGTGNGVHGMSTSGTAGLFEATSGTGLSVQSTSGTLIANFVDAGSSTSVGIQRASGAIKWIRTDIIRLLPPATTSGPIDIFLPNIGGTLAIDSTVVHIAGAETIVGDKNFNAYSENQINSTTTGGGTLCTLTITASTFQILTLTASVACVVTMPPAGTGRSITLMVRQPAATGNASATFTNVQWGSAGAPTITTGAGKMDILTFISDGVKWYGSYIQGFTY